MKLAYLVTHPIQYQTPLLRQVADLGNIEFTAFFQSDISTREHVDPGFGQSITWDVPLLEGYDHTFLPVMFGSADHVTAWSPFSSGLLRALKRGKFDALWVFGYNRPYNIFAIFAAMALGIKVVLRDEPNDHAGRRKGPVEALKKVYMRIFSALGGVYLAIGSQNAAYFRKLGMAADRIFIGPYSVDNAFFQRKVALAKPDREGLRARLGFSATAPVILYASKFIHRKHPDDLVTAYSEMLRQFDAAGLEYPYLLFAGSGEMYESVKDQAHELGLDRVRFLGFQNQSELPALYDLCDLFVLPSSDENWGLVVNEAMNASCAIVVSDEVGSHSDLVRPGENGYVVPVGDRPALAHAMWSVVGDRVRAAEMGRKSVEIINNWGYEQLVRSLVHALDKLFLPKGRL